VRARIGIAGIVLLTGFACNPISDWPSSSSNDGMGGQGQPGSQDAGAGGMAPRQDAAVSEPPDHEAMDASAGARDAGSSACSPSGPDAQASGDAGADAAPDASGSDSGDADAALGDAGSDGSVSTFVATPIAPDAEAGSPVPCL
jgi:hypothetical protein